MKIATSTTKENLLKLINEYYYSTNYIITDNNEVVNTKLNKVLGFVKENKKRFEYHTN
jgi:hypothetical protein